MTSIGEMFEAATPLDGSVPVPVPGEDWGVAGTGKPFGITMASTIKPEPMTWLWKESDDMSYIPAKQLTVLCGREQSGKSSFGLWLLARLTRGELPGDYFGKPMNVVYVAVEDAWPSTVVPRLMAAGADLERVGRLENPESPTGRFYLPEDLDRLQRFIEDNQVGAILVDPFTSVLSTTKQNDQSAVRLAVEPLYKMAQTTGCTMLIVCHVNKSGEGDIASRINGSGAFKDTARSILAFGYNPDTGERVMSAEKHSYSAKPLAREYTVDGCTVEADGEVYPTQKASLGGGTDRDARDVLDEYLSGGARKESRGNRAASWLTGYLTEHGAMQYKRIAEDARVAGISKNALYDARDILKDAGEMETDSPVKGYWSLVPVPAMAGAGLGTGTGTEATA